MSSSTHTFIKASTQSKDRSTLWNLHLGKYRVYGITNSKMATFTEILSPPHFFSCTIATPPVVQLKVELEVDLIINLSNSFDDDRCPLPKRNSSSMMPNACPNTQSSDLPTPSPSLLASSVKKPQCRVYSLQRLANMPSSKNVLKKLDYDSLNTIHTRFLPLRFDGDVMFVFSPVSGSTIHTKARSMDGMDKCNDDHV